jgi:hypothetical protein
MIETQIKLVKMLTVTLVGLTFFQSFTIKRLMRELNTGRSQFDKLKEATEYLLEIINENDIELTEFDLIALTAINDR